MLFKSIRLGNLHELPWPSGLRRLSMMHKGVGTNPGDVRTFFFCKIFFEAGIKEAGPRRAMEGSSNFLLVDVRTMCHYTLELADCCRTQF